MKKDFFAPVAVLFAICLMISAALALTNELTVSIIEGAEKKAAEEAQIEMLPEAEGFTLVENDHLPKEVTEIYRADNGAGYVVIMSVQGYGGDVKIICGINTEGEIVNTKTLSHSETNGIGSKITGEEFATQFIGKDSKLQGVQAITGASISSEAYIAAVKSAFEAYKIAEEGGFN
jgi:Predicted NADH:ubiquinone oxidoreductase, subunit RnfG